MSAQDYPYIRAWCRMMGSSAAWTRDELEQARKDNAPQDATYYSPDGWHMLSEVTLPATLALLHDLAKASA